MAALRTSWRALLVSRALVWIAGSGTLLAFGFGPARKAFNPPGSTRGFGWLGDLLAGPAARWDASWYLAIAHHGYRPELLALARPRAAFFPAYPLGLAAVSRLGVPAIVAGVGLSLAALLLALYGIHRLTLLELGSRQGVAFDRAQQAARLAVLATALAPMAFYLSAVYSEALYLALSVGLFCSARNGRWAAAGLLGALAAATRSAGVLLLLPALILYLYGPREDRPPDLRKGPAGRVPAGQRDSWWRARRAVDQLAPRYRLRSDVIWLGLIPAGLALYMAYLGLAAGDALLPFDAQAAWGRHFTGPFAGLWDGLRAAFEGARQLLSFQRHHVYFPAASGDPAVAASHNLLLAGFLVAALPAIVGVARRLPLAYLAYVLAALALALSDPVAGQPLMSLPRFLLVLFPLSMWLGCWLAGRPRAQRPLLGASALLMAFFAAQFASWHWVA
jgi:mannosyltransferase PIG-V